MCGHVHKNGNVHSTVNTDGEPVSPLNKIGDSK